MNHVGTWLYYLFQIASQFRLDLCFANIAQDILDRFHRIDRHSISSLEPSSSSAIVVHDHSFVSSNGDGIPLDPCSALSRWTESSKGTQYFWILLADLGAQSLGSFQDRFGLIGICRTIAVLLVSFGSDLVGLDLPNAQLHIASKNHIPIRLGTRDHISLIIISVSHNICLHVGSPGQQYLTSVWIAFRVFHARKRLCSVADTTEYHLCRWVGESGRNGG